MQLETLTRNAFQLGLSPTQWVELCKIQLERNATQDPDTAITQSVLALFQTFPRARTLQEYLKTAIDDGILRLPQYVVCVLSAIKSPLLQNATTIELLVRVAVDRAAGFPAVGTIVSFSESTESILNLISDCCDLLRVSCTLPSSQYNQHLATTCQLLILLISSISDLSSVTSVQATILSQKTSELTATYQLSPETRDALNSLVVALSVVWQGNGTVPQDPQALHSIQFGFRMPVVTDAPPATGGTAVTSLRVKSDMQAPFEPSDSTHIGMLLHHMVMYRATNYGSGNTRFASMQLAACIQATSTGLDVARFYTQVFLAAFTELSQVLALPHSHFTAHAVVVWRSFVLSRLPRILLAMETSQSLDTVTDVDLRAASFRAISRFFQEGTSLLAQCNQSIGSELETPPHNGSTSSLESVKPSSKQLSHIFLQQLTQSKFLSPERAQGIDHTVSVDSPSPLRLEAVYAGLEFEPFFENKLAVETSREELAILAERVVRDVSSHAAFSEVLYKQFLTHTDTLELELISNLSALLHSNRRILDIVALHTQLTDIIGRGMLVLEEFDPETVGDPQTAIRQLGDIVLFLQSALVQYQLRERIWQVGGRRVTTDLLVTAHYVHQVNELPRDDAVAFRAWYKALFDGSSEGIDDAILRSTKPRALLRIAATLVSSALAACDERRLDVEVLRNGISYFRTPLLEWALYGVIKALTSENTRKRFVSPLHIEIMQELLLHCDCPRSTLAQSSQAVLTLLSHPKAVNLGQTTSFDPVAIRRRLSEVLGQTGEEIPLQPHASSATPQVDLPRRIIREAFIRMRSGKTPFIPIAQVLSSASPRLFLDALWTELVQAAKGGEINNCRNFAIYALVLARCPAQPPLLPLFLQGTLPPKIVAFAKQPLPELTMMAEMLTSILSSTLTMSMHLERGTPRPPQGQFADIQVVVFTTTTLSRQLAVTLRKQGGALGEAVAQKLSSLPTFAATFPAFATS